MIKKKLTDELIQNLDDVVKNESKTTFVDNQELLPKICSSGSLIIDRLTQISGYPIGAIIEIFGQPSTGKTTLALHAAKSFQLLTKRKVIYFDLERTLNLNYVKKIGINIDNFLVLRPENAEITFNLIEKLLQTKEASLIIVDSVSALLPALELQSKMQDNTIGLQARIMSKALRKINYLLTEFQASLIFINQIREKIKMFFGNPETTSGGNALRFYASLRIELRNKGKILNTKQQHLGINVKVNVLKNKLGRTQNNGLINIFFNQGINYHYELLTIALEQGLINLKGAWYFYDKLKLGLGWENAVEKLTKDFKLSKELFNQLKF